MSRSVLLAEDDKLQRSMLSALLEQQLKYSVIEVENGRDALTALEADKDDSIALIVLDLSMPVMDGMEALKHIARDYTAIPVIVLTASADVKDAVKAMKLGATDFLSKPVESKRMMVSVNNALKISTLTKEVSRLKREKKGVLTFNDLVGHERGLAAVSVIGRKAAASDIPVLITGETGVGKELFARAIHGASVRSGAPFVAVNCGAIPEQLVESILFGHEKGAFTGAINKMTGKFREAHGGTIFLDEVGELPAAAQVKLLRVLQEKEVEPVGAAHSVPVDVRVISATNRDMAEEVTSGRFREDLYFRLNVLPLILPPLRERREDILDLAHHFIARFSAAENQPLMNLSEEAQTFLQQHDWPGNVRELENIIYRAMVLSDGHVLKKEDFSFLLDQTGGSAEKKCDGNFHTCFLDEAGRLKTIEHFEREIMDFALGYYGGNTTKAAQALGIAKSTFYRKQKEHKGEI